MSARTLAWSELTGPHLSRHLADRQAEKDWAKFRPGPEPTWEEVREAWMAGGGEHRRQVGGCQCPYVRARAAANAEKSCDEDFCGGWSVQGCYEASGSPGFCACDWTCGGCSSNVTAVLYPCPEHTFQKDLGDGPGDLGWSGSLYFGHAQPLAQQCRLKREGEEACVDYDRDKAGPAPSAVPDRVHFGVSSYTDPEGNNVVVDLLEICGFEQATIVNVMTAAYGLLLANKDIVWHALCMNFTTTSDRDLRLNGVQEIQSLVDCVCAMLDGRGNEIRLTAQPTGVCRWSPLRQRERAEDGPGAREAVTLDGIFVNIYVGLLPDARTGYYVSPTGTVLLRALKDNPLGWSGVVTAAMAELVALIAHELLHVCGFHHASEWAGFTEDASYTFRDDIVAALRSRYGA